MTKVELAVVSTHGWASFFLVCSCLLPYFRSFSFSHSLSFLLSFPSSRLFCSSPFTFAPFVFPVLISNDHTLLIQHSHSHSHTLTLSHSHTLTHEATTTIATAARAGRYQEATLFLPFYSQESTTTFNILFFHPVATNPDALCRDPGIILQGTLLAPPRLRPSALPLCL